MVVAIVQEGVPEDSDHTPDLTHHATRTLRAMAALLRSHPALTDEGQSSLAHVEDELQNRNQNTTEGADHV